MSPLRVRLHRLRRPGQRPPPGAGIKRHPAPRRKISSEAVQARGSRPHRFRLRPPRRRDRSSHEGIVGRHHPPRLTPDRHQQPSRIAHQPLLPGRHLMPTHRQRRRPPTSARDETGTAPQPLAPAQNDPIHATHEGKQEPANTAPIGGSASAAYGLLPAKDLPRRRGGSHVRNGDPLTRMAHSPGRSALLVDPCREVALPLRAAELTQDLFRRQESLRAGVIQQIAWSQAPVLSSVCHSNATRPKEVLGSMFEKRS